MRPLVLLGNLFTLQYNYVQARKYPAAPKEVRPWQTPAFLRFSIRPARCAGSNLIRFPKPP